MEANGVETVKLQSTLARERLEWIEATDKLLAEIEQKAMLNYKITAKDGNKVVVVGQSK